MNKDDVERAAERGVVRAVERAAERAAERALASGAKRAADDDSDEVRAMERDFGITADDKRLAAKAKSRWTEEGGAFAFDLLGRRQGGE